jgi:hypothetical protein
VTDLENFLRHDLNEVAERVTEDSIRPLRVPRARRRSWAVRWLAPVAAMAAVVAVIAGVSLAANPLGQPHAPATQAGLPLYYVTVDETAPQGEQATLVATVRDSVNGAVLARSSFRRMPLAYSMPLMLSGLEMSGGGDDGQTFVLSLGSTSHLFMLRVAPDGRSMRLSRFSIPGHTVRNLQPLQVALSPDGTTLAIAAWQPCSSSGNCWDDMIRIVSLATGVTRIWSMETAQATILQLRWAGNDHVLFDGIGSSAWLLSVTGRRGGNLRAARVLPLSAPEFRLPNSLPLVTADGRTIFATTYNPPSGFGWIESVVELSARTGQVLRVEDSLSTNTDSGLNCMAYSLAATGVHALIGCGGFFGRLDNNKLTRLPGSPADIQSAAW